MFCSPFRRRRQLRLAPESPGEVYLSREEAWTLYLAKLEEEANYFSVGEPGTEAEPDICTCHTCIVSIISHETQCTVSGGFAGVCALISPSHLIHDDAYLNIL